MQGQNESVAAELNIGLVKRIWATPQVIVSMMADAKVSLLGTHHDGALHNSQGTVTS